jgi:hypothetical protein
LRCEPRDEVVLDAEGLEPAGAGDAFDGRCPAHTRPDQGPTGRDIHALPRAQAPDGVYPGRPEEGEMGVRTQAPIGHQHISCVYAWMHRLHVGQVMGEQGRHDPLQEDPGARMAQPQKLRQGNAAPRARRRRRADSSLEHRGTRAWSIPNHRPQTGEGPATGCRASDRAAPPVRSAPAGGQRRAAGVWRALGHRRPHGTVSPTHGAEDCTRCSQARSATGRAARW